MSPTAHSRAYSHHSSGPLSGLISHATFCHRMYFSRPVLIDVHAHRPCRVITMRPAVPRLASPPFPPSTAHKLAEFWILTAARREDATSTGVSAE